MVRSFAALVLCAAAHALLAPSRPSGNALRTRLNFLSPEMSGALARGRASMRSRGRRRSAAATSWRGRGEDAESPATGRGTAAAATWILREGGRILRTRSTAEPRDATTPRRRWRAGGGAREHGEGRRRRRCRTPTTTRRSCRRRWSRRTAPAGAEDVDGSRRRRGWLVRVAAAARDGRVASPPRPGTRIFRGRVALSRVADRFGAETRNRAQATGTRRVAPRARAVVLRRDGRGRAIPRSDARAPGTGRDGSVASRRERPRSRDRSGRIRRVPSRAVDRRARRPRRRSGGTTSTSSTPTDTRS